MSKLVTTAKTAAGIILAALVFGAMIAPIWVPLLRDQPEPLPDRLRWGSGSFDAKCRADLATPGELCTKELMERQQREEKKR